MLRRMSVAAARRSTDCQSVRAADAAPRRNSIPSYDAARRAIPSQRSLLPRMRPHFVGCRWQRRDVARIANPWGGGCRPSTECHSVLRCCPPGPGRHRRLGLITWSGNARATGHSSNTVHDAGGRPRPWPSVKTRSGQCDGGGIARSLTVDQAAELEVVEGVAEGAAGSLAGAGQG